MSANVPQQPTPPTQRDANEIREPLGAHMHEVTAWPYPLYTYPLRVLWLIVHRTAWRLSWKRFPVLRSMLLRLFGGKLTDLTVNAAGSAWIEMPWSISFGSIVSLGPRVILYNLGGISIGDNTVLSQDVYVCGGTHDYNDPTYPLIRTPIKIGSNVWIAAGAFIGPGVTVGDGAVVGARAVVVRDVEPWTVVAGNPARVVKKRELRPRKSTATAASPEVEQQPQ